MKRIRLFFLIVTFIFTLTQCVSTSKIMQTWVGSTKAKLYQSLGPPSRVTEDGQGGEILIYDSYVNLGQTPGTVQRNSYNNSVRYTSPQQNGYSRTRMFYVNSSGVIYNWRWKGL